MPLNRPQTKHQQSRSNVILSCHRRQR